MNFLAALLGGAAEGIGAYGKSVQDEERAVRLKQLDADLEMKRQEAIQAMRDKSDEAKAARARQANQADAATVKTEGEAIGTKRDVGNIEKARGLIGTPDREPISAEDVSNIRGMVSPEFAKAQYGLEAPSRVQSLRDSADAALSTGRTDMEKGFRDQLNQERLFERADAQDALGNKREDNAEKFRTKQLELQIANHKEVIARMGGDSATKKLAQLRLDAMTEESDWRKGVAKLPAGDPKRAAEMQRGVDMGWVKTEPNDVSTTVKTGDLTTGVETSVTTKGRAGLPKASPTIDTLFPKKEAPKPATAKADAPKPDAPKPGLIAADKPAREFYTDGTPKRAKEPTASRTDIAGAQQEVNTLQARYNVAPVGDGKNLTGPANAARMQIANSLADAKERLQKLLDQGK